MQDCRGERAAWQLECERQPLGIDRPLEVTHGQAEAATLLLEAVCLEERAQRGLARRDLRLDLERMGGGTS